MLQCPSVKPVSIISDPFFDISINDDIFRLFDFETESECLIITTLFASGIDPPFIAIHVLRSLKSPFFFDTNILFLLMKTWPFGSVLKSGNSLYKSISVANPYIFNNFQIRLHGLQCHLLP